MPLFPIAILVLGAGLVALGAPFRFQHSGPIATATTGLVVVGLVAVGTQLPLDLTLSSWGPAMLLTTPLSLHLDQLEWLFGLAIVLVLFGALLTAYSRPGRTLAIHRVYALMLSAAALLSLFSANLLTLAVTWTIFDVVFVLVILLIGRQEIAGEQATINMGLNGLSTLLLWGAMLFSLGDGSSLYFRLASFSVIQITLLAVAGVLRLGLYPLHLWLPSDAEVRPGLATMLHIAPASLGLALLGRLALLNQTALPLNDILTYVGLAALLGGSILAWRQNELAGSLSLVVLGQSGLIILAGTWGGGQAGTALIAEGLVLILAIGVLFISPGFNPAAWYWAIPGTLAALALAGAPPTLGFISRAANLRALVQAGAWPVLLGIAVGQGLLFASALRVAWRPLDTNRLHEFGVAALAAAGLALTSFPLLLGGLAPMQLLHGVVSTTSLSLVDALGMMPAGGWLVLLVSLAFGCTFVVIHPNIRPADQADSSPMATNIVDLRWLFRTAGRILEFSARFVRTLALLPEGEGALTWTLLILVVVWLFMQPRK